MGEIFDITKVRLAGYLQGLKVGSKGFFANDVLSLQEQVELCCVPATLTRMDNSLRPFQKDSAFWYTYFYLIKEPKEKQYRLYTWEEREQLRGRWIRKKETFDEEECIKELHKSNISTLLINLKHASEIFEFWEFLDGSPCGVPVEDGEELVQRRQDCIAKFSKE